MLARKAVDSGVVGVQFGAKSSAAVFIPFERRERNSLLTVAFDFWIGPCDPIEQIPGVAARMCGVFLPLGADGRAQGFIGFVPDIVGKGFDVPGGIDQLQRAAR